MSDFAIASTSKQLTKRLAQRIDRAVKKIDPTASFDAPLNIEICGATGWIVRPNDGTNGYGYRCDEAQRMREAMERELAK